MFEDDTANAAIAWLSSNKRCHPLFNKRFLTNAVSPSDLPLKSKPEGRRKPSVSVMTSARFSQSQCYACVLYASAKFVGGTNGTVGFR